MSATPATPGTTQRTATRAPERARVPRCSGCPALVDPETFTATLEGKVPDGPIACGAPVRRAAGDQGVEDPGQTAQPHDDHHDDAPPEDAQAPVIRVLVGDHVARHQREVDGYTEGRDQDRCNAETQPRFGPRTAIGWTFVGLWQWCVHRRFVAVPLAIAPSARNPVGLPPGLRPQCKTWGDITE